VPGCRVWAGGQWVQDHDRSWRDPGFATAPRDDEPVVCVSWDDARAYAEWLSARSGKRYRLPSEAEWEYVARGGTSFPRYWGEHDSREDLVLSLACDYANVYDSSAVDALHLPWPNARCSDRAPMLAPVAQYKPNAFGVYDIIGNAREWVMDCFTTSYAAAVPGRAGPGMRARQRAVQSFLRTDSPISGSASPATTSRGRQSLMRRHAPFFQRSHRAVPIART
jgi:formylglycine-generating enzyme required for sulfatase activity